MRKVLAFPTMNYSLFNRTLSNLDEFPFIFLINILAYFTENIQKVSFIRTATCYLSLAVMPSYMNIRKNLGKCLHIAEK